MELAAIVTNRIWTRGYPVRLFGTRFDARMTIIRLRNGELLLHSPCEIAPEICAEIESLGSVAHIVVPSNYHTLYAASAQKAFPDAKTWICPGVERRRPDMKYDGILGDEAPSDWSGEIEQAIVQGRIMSEIAMLHRESKTLIVVDLIENFTDATPHVSGVVKFLFKNLLGMWNNPRPAPEFRMGWRDRSAAETSLSRILSWDFDRIIVAHGDIIERDAPATAPRAWRL